VKSKVAVFSTRSVPLGDCVRALFRELGWDALVPAGGLVVLKPNLSWPGRDKALYANTSAQVLDSVISVLREKTDNIVVGEADGTRFSVEECFEASGYVEVVRAHGARWVNFSRARTEPVGVEMLRGFELPSELIHCDLFVTLPKLKTHGLTYFTGALKNQWGCIPRHDRILLHKHLDELIVELNALLRPSLCIMDAVWAMEGRGPVNGRGVRLDMVLGSSDPVALDASAMRMVGLNPLKSRHVCLARDRGLGAFSEKEIQLVGDVGERHELEPAKSEWTVKLMNYLTRYGFFTRHVLLNNRLFSLGKSAVSVLRRFGVA
jgi:uncharacterized protein (DUF362 family)